MSAARNLQQAWKPGQSGNPGGRPKLSEELRAIQALTQVEVCRLVSKYARMGKEQIQLALDDPRTPMLELSIASIFVQCTKNGDYTRLSFLLDRAIGKVPVIAETDEESAAREEIQNLSTEELIRLVKPIIQEIDKAGA